MSRFVLVFSPLVLLLGTLTLAQTDPAGGMLPFSTHVGGQYDSVDLASSNVTLNIPIRAKAGKIPFTFSLIANAHFSIQGIGNRYWSNPMQGVGMRGASLSSVFGAYVNAAYKNFGSCHGHSSDPGNYNYYITDAMGGVHHVNTQWDEYGCYTSGNGATTDGSGLRLAGSGLVDAVRQIRKQPEPAHADIVRPRRRHDGAHCEQFPDP